MRKNFLDTIMAKKGKAGEALIDEMVAKRGQYSPYAPIFEGSHPFDRLLVSKDKKKLLILEVKSVTVRKYYPDTGISIAHWEEYNHIIDSYGLDVFIVFVDETLREVYGNYLTVLQKDTTVTHNGRTLQYPKKERNFSAVGGYIMYFPLCNMIRNLFTIDDQTANELQALSNYGYKQDMTHKRGYKDWKARR
jgi:hypothetical protein